VQRYKGVYWPNQQDDELGFRVLHPMRDMVNDHVRVDPVSAELVGMTAAGSFHIELLHLNRPALVRHRLKEKRRRLKAEERAVLEAECERLRGLLRQQEEWIETLTKKLSPPESELKP
jgi:hypothetical protein